MHSHSDLTGYKAVVLPDEIPLGGALAAKLDAYLTSGGAILASFRSGLVADGENFALGLAWGLEWHGSVPYLPDISRSSRRVR